MARPKKVKKRPKKTNSMEAYRPPKRRSRATMLLPAFVLLGALVVTGGGIYLITTEKDKARQTGEAAPPPEPMALAKTDVRDSAPQPPETPPPPTESDEENPEETFSAHPTEPDAQPEPPALLPENDEPPELAAQTEPEEPEVSDDSKKPLTDPVAERPVSQPVAKQPPPEPIPATTVVPEAEPVRVAVKRDVPVPPAPPPEAAPLEKPVQAKKPEALPTVAKQKPKAARARVRKPRPGPSLEKQVDIALDAYLRGNLPWALQILESPSVIRATAAGSPTARRVEELKDNMMRAEGLYRQATYLEGEGRYSEAVRVWHSFLEKDREISGGKTSSQFRQASCSLGRLYYLLGKEKFDQGKIQSASALWKMANRIDSANADVQAGLRKIQKITGKTP